MTWTGPKRLEPYVEFRVFSDATGAWIVADGGRVEPDGPEVREWREWLEQLLEEAIPATGGG